MRTQYAPPMPAPDLPPKGLPEHLPRGERLIWQGAPDWRAMARNVFRARLLAVYFAAILGWSVLAGVSDGLGASAVMASTGQMLAAATVPLALVVLYSWMVARSTTYSITDARVVMKFGLGLPMTINLPYCRIEAAALKVRKDGSGDISLLLGGKDRLAYLVLWPHARPWRMKNAEPTLRAIPDAARVGQLMARALAASANLPVPAMVDQPVPAEQGIAVPA